jgi:hypothetical protein
VDGSHFHVMWMFGLEVQMTCISRFPVHFRGQFRIPLHDQDAQERTGILSFNFHSEFDGRPYSVEMVKKLLEPYWSMWPNHECVVDVFESFSGFVVCCVQCYFLKLRGC